MRQAQIIRSNTFHRALTVAGVFATFVIVLFAFIYWQTDRYLIARSDRMITRQLNVIVALAGERQLDAIDEHLRQDSRGVQYAGLFAADGSRITGNLEQLPAELKINDSVQSLSVVRTLPASREIRVIRAIARRVPNGDALMIDERLTKPEKFPMSSVRRWRWACCLRFAYACLLAPG